MTGRVLITVGWKSWAGCDLGLQVLSLPLQSSEAHVRKLSWLDGTGNAAEKFRVNSFLSPIIFLSAIPMQFGLDDSCIGSSGNEEEDPRRARAAEL